MTVFRTPGQLYRSQSALRTILQSITVLQLKSYRTVQLNYQALQLPATIIGVATGFQYTNSTGQTVQAQYYPGTSVTNAIAYVVVDASAEFKVTLTVSGAPTVVVGANATIVGTNVAEIQNGTGSATTGNAQLMR
jgi:hypothetical protein